MNATRATYISIKTVGRFLLNNVAMRSAFVSVPFLAIVICLGYSGTFASRNQPARPQAESGVIRGTILDETGRKLANVKITARNPAAHPSIFFSSTDDNGSFVLSSLPWGKYDVTFEIDGYRKETVQFDLKPGQPPSTIEIKLNPSSLQGAIVDIGSSRPLRGVSVTLRNNGGKEVSKTTTDEAGQYSFGRLPSGVYNITTTLTGYESASTQLNIPLQNTFSFTLAKASTILVNNHKAQSFPVVNPSSSSSASNQVQKILQDKEGLLWFGTARGVSTFDGGQSFAQFDRSPDIETENIRAIIEDRDGDLWFGTDSGVARYHAPTKTVSREITGYTVRDICQDDDGLLWIASNKGLVRFDGKEFKTFTESDGLMSDDVSVVFCDGRHHSVRLVTGRGLFNFDGKNFLQTPAEQELQSLNLIVKSITQDKYGNIWLATTGGVFQFTNDKLTQFDKSEVLRNRPVSDMLLDSEGRFWFATDIGVTLYDPVKNESLQFPDTADVQTLYEDRESNLWLGTANGAIRYDIYSFVTLNTNRGLTSNDVRAIWPERGKNRIWIATARGINIFDGARLVPPEKIPAEDTRSIIQDHNGTFWIGTSRGLIRSEGSDVKMFTESDGLPSNDVRYAAEDANGTIWVATGRGVARLTGDKMTAVDALNGVDSRHIAEGMNGALLVSTDRGLYRQVGDEGHFINQSEGLPSNNVYCSLRDNEGTVWVATDHGVRRLLNGSFVGFPKGEALANESVRTIFQDSDGFLWFGTSDGKLKKFLPFNGTALVETYNTDRSGIPVAVSHSIIQDSTGHIWLATEAGAVRHLPDRSPPTTRVRVFVNGRETDETNLSSGRYNIAFNFQGISPSGEVQYAYRLDGYDKDWHLLGPTEERRVSYNDLPSGTFAFQVRSFNHDLYSIDAAKTSIEVAVPFYLKGWFFALSGLAVIGLGVGAVAIKRQQERGPALPPHLQQFVAIEPNPYIVGNPIRNEQMFYGREDDFRYVQTKLEGAPQGVVIVFCGERRTGKSSILYQILNGRLGQRFVPVFIDMQEMVVNGDREFFGRIAKLVAQTMGSAGQDTLERYPFSATDQNPYELFTEYIEECLRILKNNTLLLLVDEYELLETKVSDGKLNDEIFTYFAALMEKHEHLGFIFTGSRRLEERDKRYWGKMLSRAIYRKVSYLSEDDTRRLIIEPVRDRVVYHRNVMDAIVRLTSGQPFYTQVICQNLVDYLNENEKNLMLSSDLKQIVEEIFDHPLPQMIYFWDSLNDDEKITLSLLGEALGDSMSYASTKDLMRIIRRNNYPVNLSEDTVHLTLEELFRTEVLLKSFDDSYRFRVGLFRAWIRRSHSIWQVVKGVKTQ